MYTLTGAPTSTVGGTDSPTRERSAGVAAQWCGTAPESYRKSLEVLWAREGFGKPNWGLRRTIQNDLSPFAGFIAANYGLP